MDDGVFQQQLNTLTAALWCFHIMAAALTRASDADPVGGLLYSRNGREIGMGVFGPESVKVAVCSCVTLHEA